MANKTKFTTIYATYIHDPQESHHYYGEAIDEYRFFKNIEDARKDLLEGLLEFVMGETPIPGIDENDRELKVWLAACEIWPTDDNDEALDEWPIGRQEANDDGTVACLYQLSLN